MEHGVRSYIILISSLLLISFLSVVAFFIYSGSITGKVTSDLSAYDSGSRVAGTFNVNLEEGDFIPADSSVTFSVNKYTKVKPISEFIKSSPKLGYYGPLVAVTIIFDKTSGSGSSGSVPSDNSPGNPQGDSRGNQGDGNLPPGGGGGGESTSVSISGSAVSDNSVTLYVKEGQQLSYDIPKGYEARLVEAKVYYNEKSLPLSYVSISSDGKKLFLTTTYLEQVYGFYLPFVKNFKVNLLDFSQPFWREGPKNVEIKVNHGNEVLASQSSSIVIGSGGSEDVLQQGQDISSSNPPYNADRIIDPLVLEKDISSLCKEETCTDFGECASPSLAQINLEGLDALTFVKSQQCICLDNGETYTRARLCEPENPNYEVSSYSSRSKTKVLDLSKAQPHLESDEIIEHTPLNEIASYSLDDISLNGHISRSLKEGEKIVLRGSENHDIGIVDVSSLSNGGKLVLVEVKSNTEQVYLAPGEFGVFDILGGIVVSVVGVSGNSVIVDVSPVDAEAWFSVADNERAVKLSNSEGDLAYVVSGEGKVDLFILQSPKILPAYCSNGIRDDIEEGVDCGGACSACRENPLSYALTLWLAVIALLLIIALYKRTRRRQ